MIERTNRRAVPVAVTAKQIQREFKITRRTLSKYTALGMIPAPLTVSRPGERGVHVVWNNGVRDRLRRIQQLQQEGKTIGEISALMSMVSPKPEATPRTISWDQPLQSWPDAPAAALVKSRDVLSDHPDAPPLAIDPESAPPTAIAVLRRLLWESLHDLTANASLSTDAVAHLTFESIAHGFVLYRSGYNPVFVYNPAFRSRDGADGTPAYVTADFMIPHEVNPFTTVFVADRNDTDQAVGRIYAQSPRILVPFADILRDASLFTTYPLSRVQDPVAASDQELTFFFTTEDATFDFSYTISPTASWPSGPLAFAVVAHTGRVSSVGAFSRNNPTTEQEQSGKRVRKARQKN